MSSEVIDAGKAKVIERSLDHKHPTLLVNEAQNLKFDFLSNARFDYILAQSVFSHLLPEHIEECFAHLDSIMNPGARFFFTHHPGTEFRQRSQTDFEYPKSFFQKLAAQYGFTLEDYSDEYQHPRGQRMLMVAKAE